MTKLDNLEKQLEAALKAAQREAASCAFLAPVFDFLKASKTWPREVLEARYEHEYGHAPPLLRRHEWLRDAVAYLLQVRAYAAAGRPVPERVVVRARGYDTSPMKTYAVVSSWAAGDPKFDAWTFPPEVRVTCAANPCQRGDGWTVAELVVQAGPAGVAFAPLETLAVALLGNDINAGRARAAACFTEHVAAGKMKLHFDFSNPAPAPAV